MLVNRRTIRIEWGDCDPAGIVFYPRYFAMFNECAVALFEAAGLPKKRQMLKDFKMAGFPMVECRARFLVPSRFGDDVVVESRVVEWRRSSFDIEHKLYRDGTLGVECFETRVWAVPDPADPERIKGAAVPQMVRDRFSVAAK